MILETERLILRPWDETDAESLFEYAKDERIGPITGWPVHTSVENSREVIKNVLSQPENYAVCFKKDERAIGCVALTCGKQSNLDLPEDEGEIGYWIGVPFWGQGLIPEATRELIRHAFADLKLKTLWCGYFEGNEKSKRCQEKCGFVYHHTQKDILWKPMNDIRTEHVTRLTKEDWKSVGFIETDSEQTVNGIRFTPMIYDRNVKLVTERLYLREMNPEDLDSLSKILTDSDIMRHYPYTFDEKRIKGWIHKNIERYRIFGFGLWAVCLKETGEMIGDCGLTMQNINGSICPEIGYHIRRDMQKNGYAKEAAKAVRDWAFDNTPFHLLFSYMKKENVPSASTAKSIGMQKAFDYTDSEGEISSVYSIAKKR